MTNQPKVMSLQEWSNQATKDQRRQENPVEMGGTSKKHLDKLGADRKTHTRGMPTNNSHGHTNHTDIEEGEWETEEDDKEEGAGAKLNTY